MIRSGTHSAAPVVAMTALVVIAAAGVRASADDSLNVRFPNASVPVGRHLAFQAYHYSWSSGDSADTELSGLELRWSVGGERWSFRAALPGVHVAGEGTIVAVGPGLGTSRVRNGGGESAGTGQRSGPTPVGVATDAAATGAVTTASEATATSTAQATTTETGLGDARLETATRLGRDTGAGRFRARAGVKVPTADASRGLGTGETDFWAGFDWLREGWTTDVEAYLEWVVLGDRPDQALQDGPAAGLFLGWPIGRGGLRAGVEAARGAVPEDPSRVRAVGGGRMAMGREGAWVAEASAGLTESAPDFGLSATFLF